MVRGAQGGVAGNYDRILLQSCAILLIVENGGGMCKGSMKAIISNAEGTTYLPTYLPSWGLWLAWVGVCITSLR